MTICREWTLVKHLPEFRLAKPLKCRSWSCELCAPERKAKLFAQAAAGNPTRFLTLTVNPKVGTDPGDRLDKLANAWRLCVKRLRRLHPKDGIEYLAIVEETKAGEPHLHILLRAPFIPQRLISAWMGEIMESPIVDIRKVRNAGAAIAYVAKYVTKAPKQFGCRKRYWMSGRWEPPWEPPADEQIGPKVPWLVDRRRLEEIIGEWCNQGYAPRRQRADTIIGIFADDSQLL